MKVKLLFPLFALLFSISTFSQTINTQLTDLVICDFDNDGTGEFDLQTKDIEILNGLSPNNYEITYHQSLQEADIGMNALVSPYTNTTNPQTIFVRIFENATGNLEITNFDLLLNPTPAEPSPTDVIACDEGNGFATFDLTLFDAEFTGGNPNLSVSYFETLTDAFNDLNAIANPESYVNIIPYSQEIYIRIYDPNTDCFVVSSNSVLYLNVDQGFIVNNPTPLEECDDNGDGIATFNLESKYDEILGGNQNPTAQITFHETQSDAENFINPLNPIYTNIVPNIQTVFVRVASNFGDCAETTTLDLIVNSDCVSASDVEVNLCGDDPNTPLEYDLTSQEAVIVNGQDSSSFSFEYYQSQTNAQTQINPIMNPQAYVVSGNSSLVFVRVVNNITNNFAIVEYDVNFNLNPQVDFNGPYFICSGQEVVLTPFVNGGSGQYNYLWSTGDTNPEIVVFTGGTYTVEISDPNTGCSASASVEVIEGESVLISDAQDLSACGSGNSTFDLTTVIPQVLNGLDPNTVEIAFYSNFNDVFNQVNPITNPTQYTSVGSQQTIYIRVDNLNNDCFSFGDFNLISEDCPIEVLCGEDPVNNTYCYELNDATAYTYISTDGSPLQVYFNAGQVENTWDELVVLDSDGITNLNPQTTTYGNNGDLTGLSFTSTGDTLTIYVDSDNVFACADQNYTPIDYDVSCVDPNALPNCLSVLTTPENGAVNVNENTDLTWTASSGVVSGYKLSLGLTSGGTEVLDHLDVGNVLTYDVGTLDYEVTYFTTIIPYNDNGDAIECNEESFTVRANPNQVVSCDQGAVNTTYCYVNNDSTQFGFQSSDGQPLTLFFNTGSTEVNFDEISIIDSDGTVLNPNLPYGNAGDFSGLSYTSSGSSITVTFDTDGSISCGSGSGCCTVPFDFDVFCASSVGIIEVNAFVDDNANAIFDTNEFSFSNGYFTYEVNGDGMINTVNSSTGSFQIISANETDTYEISFNLYEESAGCYDITTSVFNGISIATGSIITVDFPVVEEQSCEDLAVYLINYWTPPRPGFSHENHIVLENLGFTNIASGSVEFTHDSQLVFNSVFDVNPNYTITSTATGFIVNFVNLQPGDVEYIDISLTCPASVELGEIVTNSATYITDSNDLVSSNNYSTLSEVVVGSWDPNDKMEAHGPRLIYDDFAASDEWLYYTIRFQNLGTFPATFVRIEDALDNQLDEATFQMLRASHDYVVTRTETDLEWFFDDINLPAEQDDADGSQGFVYFRIKPKAGYAIGDIIPNTAAIFFDFNAPVITNRFDSEFVEESLSVSDVDVTAFNLFPNPASGEVTIELNSNALGNVTVHVIDLQGKLILRTHISEGNTITLDISELQSGIYFVKLNTIQRSLVKKLVIE